MTNFCKPCAVGAGDRVAVLSPASPCDRSVTLQGIDELRELGFIPVFDEGIFVGEGFFAGSAPYRAEAFRKAWSDPDIKAVFATRGGYGSAEILPLLKSSEIRKKRKVFVGFSDLTSLLVYLTNYCGVTCFHGPMMMNFARGSVGYDKDSLIKALTSRTPVGEIFSSGIETLKSGENRGVLLGGTLTQLLASLGTPYEFDPPDGYVLFLDDIGERPYRVDRMLIQLKQSGLLKRASAVVFGEFPDCQEVDCNDVRSVILRVFDDFSGPVLYGFPSGHTTGPTITLPFGVDVTVKTGSHAGIVVEEAAVT